MRLEQSERVAILRMESGRANAIDAAFLSGLEGLLDELDQSDATAAVLTGRGRFFCAGLALPALVDLDRDEMRDFMTRFSDVMERVFTHPKPLVAAINGYAIAGGCVLALQCDYRVIVDGPTRIGLNEIKLGLGLPPVALESLRAVVPPADRMTVANRGTLMAPKQAQSLGLVDEVVVGEHVEPRALHHAALLGARPAAAFAQIKEGLREPALQRMREHRAERLDRWLDTWFGDEAQSLLRDAVASLGRSRR